MLWWISSRTGVRFPAPPLPANGRIGTPDPAVRASRLLLQSRLAGGQPGDRNSIGGARHVVEAHRVTQLHRLGLAAVLAADADLERRARGPAVGDGHANQLADSGVVEDAEGILGKDPLLDV